MTGIATTEIQKEERLAFDKFKQKKVDQYEFIDFFDIKSGGKSFIVLEKNKIGSRFEESLNYKGFKINLLIGLVQI